MPHVMLHAHSVQLHHDLELAGEGEEIQIYCQETRKKYTTKIIRAGEVQWLRTH